jgi:hypothetical protein
MVPETKASNEAADVEKKDITEYETDLEEEREDVDDGSDEELQFGPF